MSTFLEGVLVFVVVIIGLVAFDAYVCYRREKRLRSQATSTLREVRDHSDAQIEETRMRTDANVIRVCAFMEEHTSLLREILAELKCLSNAPAHVMPQHGHGVPDNDGRHGQVRMMPGSVTSIASNASMPLNASGNR